jgi:hypothetical protein
MSAPTSRLIGDELLVAVTDAMVGLHERYHHRKPVTAKTLLLGGTCSPACSEASTPTSRRR